jgi:hypothetical protein
VALVSVSVETRDDAGSERITDSDIYSIFRGTGWTGRVVYFTMGMPIVMGIIIVGRGVSLENAGEGIKLYFATWRGSQLSSPGVWQAACGQVISFP